jgi:hypothetical protein
VHELGGGSEDAAAEMTDPRSMATTQRPLRSYLDGDVLLELPAPGVVVPPSAGSRGLRSAQLRLIACSRCLRVLCDEEWVRPETVIRELRTFDYQEAPRLEPVLCPLCTFSIQLRRAHGRAPLHGETARSRDRR